MVAKKIIPVLVTTVHRGVFFGYVDEKKITDKTLTLTKCRNCIYWAASVGGFIGLAATGPNRDCKIGAEATEVLLHDITSVTHCTEVAATAWAQS